MKKLRIVRPVTDTTSRSLRQLVSDRDEFEIVRLAVVLVVSVFVLFTAISLLMSPRLADERAVSDGVVIVSLAWPFVVLFCAALVMIMLLFASYLITGLDAPESNLDGMNSLLGGSKLLEGVSESQRTLKLTDLPANQSVRWQQYEGVQDSQVAKRILCVGSICAHERMACLARRLVWTRCSVDLVNDFDSALDVISATPSRWNLLIVDVDYVEKHLDIDDIVRDLITFREDCSSCAIALLSISFASDEGSLIRSSIADYSFRSTVSNERLIATLPAIFENHNAFLQRKTERLEAEKIVPFDRTGGA